MNPIFDTARFVNFRHRRNSWFVDSFSYMAALFCLLSMDSVSVAEQYHEEHPAVKQAIEKGLNSLKRDNIDYRYVTGLVTYTLLSGGESIDSPYVQRGLAAILRKINLDSQIYQPTRHHIYEATIDILALEAADPELYFDHISAIANYIITSQENYGGWFYPGDQKNAGDTSITQYAILGLWTAHRTGVLVPVEVLERAAAWHFNTQNANGGYPYQYGDAVLSQRSPSGSMTCAGAGSLSIIRTILFDTATSSPVVNPEKNKSNPLAFLEKVNRSNKNKEKKRPTVNQRPPKPIRPQIKQSIQGTFQWMNINYANSLPAPSEGKFYYYFYTLERAATLNGWQEIDNQDWYHLGATEILPLQEDNGSWPEKGRYTEHSPSGTCSVCSF